MIYRKRPYTPLPMRAVRGTVHTVTLAADGVHFQISYHVSDCDAQRHKCPRKVLAARLVMMRQALRKRLEQYRQGVTI